MVAGFAVEENEPLTGVETLVGCFDQTNTAHFIPLCRGDLIFMPKVSRFVNKKNAPQKGTHFPSSILAPIYSAIFFLIFGPPFRPLFGVQFFGLFQER
jgi:hypothetical protein